MASKEETEGLCSEAIEKVPFLLSSQQCFDCTFVFGKSPHRVVIGGHKLILALASPVFWAMFYGELCEETEVVEIKDIQPETFKLLLDYIYKGNFNVTSIDEACDLYHVAHKYMLKTLEENCETYLKTSINVNNVWQLFEFARLFDAKQLKLTCENIICTDTKNVLQATTFVDVDLETVIDVFSYEFLNIDSELDLIKAAGIYANNQKDICIADRKSDHLIGTPCPTVNMADDKSVNIEANMLTMENNHKTGDAKPFKMVSSHSEIDDQARYRRVMEKLRLLTLTPEQFVKCTDLFSMLSIDNRLAILMSIVSRDVPMPINFSTRRSGRHLMSNQFWNVKPTEMSVRYQIRDISNVTDILSPASFLADMPWQFRVVQHEQQFNFIVICNGMNKAYWSCLVGVRIHVGKPSSGLPKNEFDDWKEIHNGNCLFCKEVNTLIKTVDITDWGPFEDSDGLCTIEVEIEQGE